MHLGIPKAGNFLWQLEKGAYLLAKTPQGINTWRRARDPTIY